MYLVLGDVVAQGYDPHGTIERLAGLDNVVAVMGNTDRWVLDLDWRAGTRAALGPTSPDGAVRDLAPVIAAGFAWTHGCLAATAHLDWLAALPSEFRTTLPSGKRLLAAHTAPTIDGPEIEPDTPEESVVTMLASAHADLVCLGDTHLPMDRTIGGVRVVNPGAIGNPIRDRGEAVVASYALIEDEADGVGVELRTVTIDSRAVIEAIGRSHFAPNPDWLAAKYAG